MASRQANSTFPSSPSGANLTMNTPQNNGNSNGNGNPSPEVAPKKRKGARTVSSLTPTQLARKRANDREAQRAIRARTKEYIERLERQVKELEQRPDNQELDRLRRENHQLRDELDVSRRNSTASMGHYLGPSVMHPFGSAGAGIHTGFDDMSAASAHSHNLSAPGGRLSSSSASSGVFTGPPTPATTQPSDYGVLGCAPAPAAGSGFDSPTGQAFVHAADGSMEHWPSPEDYSRNNSFIESPGAHTVMDGLPVLNTPSHGLEYDPDLTSRESRLDQPRNLVLRGPSPIKFDVSEYGGWMQPQGTRRLTPEYCDPIMA